MKTYFVYYSKADDKIVVENERGETAQVLEFKGENVNITPMWGEGWPRLKIKVECNSAKYADDDETLIFT